MRFKEYIAEDLRIRARSESPLPCKLTLPALAAHFGVSLTPVRRAVTQLLTDGLLEKLPNGRLSVVPAKGRPRKPREAPSPPPTARDWDRLLIREVMVASLGREPVELREERLAHKYDVGRSIIRDSLGRLAGAGLIRHIPRRGWIVEPLCEEDIAAYVEVRELLELKALDLARPHIRADELQPILEGNRLPSGTETPLLDNSLHAYLIAKSGNRYIQNFFRQHTATYYTSAFDYAAPDAHVAAEMAAQHRVILKSLIAGRWVRARQELARHIRAQRRILSRLLQSNVIATSDDHLQGVLESTSGEGKCEPPRPSSCR